MFIPTIKLSKIYHTPKTGHLRAELVFAYSENEVRKEVLSISAKKSSFISGNGYAFSVTCIDYEYNQVVISTFPNSTTIRLNLNDEILLHTLKIACI
jgi:hypothetical protein